jgi:hypothetical protein
MTMIRPDIISSLERYVQHRIEPDGFLRACLENNLCEALGRADMENRHNIFEIVQYLYNDIPNTCWGSREKVKAWLEDECHKLKGGEMKHFIKRIALGEGMEEYQYQVGDVNVKSIEKIAKNGEMALVDWYLVLLENGSYSEVNGRYVVRVDYEEVKQKP